VKLNAWRAEENRTIVYTQVRGGAGSNNVYLLRDRAMHRCYSAVLMGLVCLAATDATHADSAMAPPPAREMLRELVEINSTHAHGSTEAAKALAARFLAAGFAPQDVTFLAPADHPTKGNLVVRLRGRGQGRPVLYIGHLDVVEAKREDWTYDPFKLTEQDGWLYGRGVIDMKGQDVAMAVALMRLKQEGFQPARDLIVAFTADEEAGGDANGVGWLLATHHDLIDAQLVINPDGGEAGMKQGRKLYVAVQTSEKNFLTFGVETTDKGGHSSRPTNDNPIYRLAAALTRLSQYRFPVHLTETTGSTSSAAPSLKPGRHRLICAPWVRGAPIRRQSSVYRPSWRRTSCCAPPAQQRRSKAATPRTPCRSAPAPPCSVESYRANRQIRSRRHCRPYWPIHSSHSAPSRPRHPARNHP
jgi:hypothetical protein